MGVMTPWKIFIYFRNMLRMCMTKRKYRKKIEAIWIRSKVHSKERLLPEKKLKLNQPGKFKLPGIQYNTIQYNKLYLKYCVNYDLFTEDKTGINLKKNK
jgi:hypothetical protein